MLELKYQKTKTLNIKENTRSSDFVIPNLIMGCNAGCSNSYCVEEGTLISTKDGQIPVEKIQDGDFVQSLNNLKEYIELKKVHHTFHRDYNSWIEIEVDQLKIVVTPEHPFYIVGKGWVEAQYLTEDDEVLCDD